MAQWVLWMLFEDTLLRFSKENPEGEYSVLILSPSRLQWVLWVVLGPLGRFSIRPAIISFLLIRGLECKLVDFIISVIWEVLIVSVSTV